MFTLVTANGVRSANWHITERCNYGCRFCFAQHMGGEIRDKKRQYAILKTLADKGIEKITFVGGEPLLHPDIDRLLRMSRDMGFTVSLQTNGSLLDEGRLDALSPFLDWIGVSIDSGNERTQQLLGRGKGDHVAMVTYLCEQIRDRGIRLKVNTTVTKLNYRDDLGALIAELNPSRWKVFQMLMVSGQNDSAGDLSVNATEFGEFCDRHRCVRTADGGRPVFETDEAMVGSYLMIGPAGDLMTNRGRRIDHAPLNLLFGELEQKIIDYSRYLSRGGVYDWGR